MTGWVLSFYSPSSSWSGNITLSFLMPKYGPVILCILLSIGIFIFVENTESRGFTTHTNMIADTKYSIFGNSCCVGQNCSLVMKSWKLWCFFWKNKRKETEAEKLFLPIIKWKITKLQISILSSWKKCYLIHSIIQKRKTTTLHTTLQTTDSERCIVKHCFGIL